MGVQEIPWIAIACLLLVFIVSTAPADEAELLTAVVSLIGLKLDGIQVHSLLCALQEVLL